MFFSGIRGCIWFWVNFRNLFSLGRRRVFSVVFGELGVSYFRLFFGYFLLIVIFSLFRFRFSFFLVYLNFRGFGRGFGG